jgi:hypothetical protein
MVIPGLEGLFDDPGRVPGARARAVAGRVAIGALA